MNRVTVLAGFLTVATGMVAFAATELRPEERVVAFDTEPRDTGPLEAINGIPFVRTNGAAVITEPLAHISFLFPRTLLGKRLVIQPRFHLDEGDVLEVGVKKTAFWLDYDRQPLQHRLLDDLLARDENTWSALRADTRIVYLNPRFPNTWQTLEDFEKAPPTDGTIGLYGNAALPTPNSLLPTPSTAPFRLSDDPDAFRAIYAWYPSPDHSDPEWTTNVQTFDLARAHQNENESLDIMFFVQAREEGKIRVLFDEIRFRVEPGWPRPRDLVALLRLNLARLVRRPPVSSEL